MASIDPVDLAKAAERDRILASMQSPFHRAVGILDVPIAQLAGVVLVFMVTFLNLANLNAAKEVVALDAQVVAKLLVIACAGLYGFLGAATDVRIRRVLLSFPVFLVVALTGFYFASSFTSITPENSLVSTIAMAAVLLMTVTAMMQLGLVRFLAVSFHGMSWFILLSWFMYFFKPEIGVFLEPTLNGEYTRRMSGLAHPNTLGQFAGMTIVVGVALYQFYGQRSNWRIFVIGLAAVALVASLSRTSLVATAMGLITMNYRWVFSATNRKWIFLGAVLFVPMLLVVATQVDLGEKIAEKMTIVSKSGEADELTSATGRAEIWQYSMKLIGKRPLVGYGAATSKYYLSEYSRYTHNLLLNIAFSTGVFGGLLGLVMILYQAATVVFRTHVIVSSLIVYILLNGLFENVIFSTIAGMPTLLWIMSMAWYQVRDCNGGEHDAKPVSLRDRFV